MKLRRILILISILLCFIISALAQQGRISGYVKDIETGEPIPYANVVVNGTDLGDATNVHGRFQVLGIPPGDHTLLVTMMGYKTRERRISIINNQDERIDIELVPTQVKGEEITVTAQESEFKRNVETSTLNLSMKELELTPSFVEQDVFRTLQMTPSVQSKNDFSSALIVRGGSPDENLILLDGMEIYNPYHLGGMFSTFNSKAISNVKFIAGGFPAKYGNRNSSVVAITNREGNSEKKLLFKNSKWADYFNLSKVKGTVSLLTSKILTEGPVGKGSWMLSWRRTYFDKLIDLYYMQKDTEPFGSYYFKDYQGKLIQDITNKDRLTLTGYSGRDFLNFDNTDDTGHRLDLGFDWGNSTIGVKWRHVPNSILHSELGIYKTNYDYDLGLSYGSTDTLQAEEEVQVKSTLEEKLDIHDWTIREKLSYYPTENHSITTGFKIKNLSLDIYSGTDGTAYFDYSQNINIYSTFLQDKWKFSPRLTIQTGLRASKYSKHDRIDVGPRLGVNYQLSDQSIIKANWGVYNQYIFTQNNEEAIIDIVNVWSAVPEYMNAQTCQHFILGIERRFESHFKIKLEGYYKPYSNLIVNNPRNNPGLNGDEFISGKGEAWGIEVLAKKERGSLTGWIGYTYSRVNRRVDFNRNGEIEEKQGEVFNSRYDQPHSVNCVLNYKLNSIHSFGLKIKSSTGQPYTPVVGKTFTQSNMGSYRNPYQNIRTIPGPKNSARYPTYFRADISYIADMQLIWGLNGKMKFQVINFTNHWNTLFYLWQHNQSPSKVVDISMFPIIPSIGFEFEL